MLPGTQTLFVYAAGLHDLRRMNVLKRRTLTPPEGLRVDEEYAVHWDGISRGLKRVVGARAKTGDRNVAGPITIAHEACGRTNIIDGARREDFVVWPIRPAAAVAKTGQIHAQHYITALRPGARQ